MVRGRSPPCAVRNYVRASKAGQSRPPEHLRRIRFKDAESGTTLVFLTNNTALPALVALRRGLAVGYLSGALGCGLAASAVLDLPAGPSVVCALALASAVLGVRLRA